MARKAPRSEDAAKVALEMGFISEVQYKDVAKTYQRARATDLPMSVSDILRGRGYLTAEQLELVQQVLEEKRVTRRAEQTGVGPAAEAAARQAPQPAKSGTHGGDATAAAGANSWRLLRAKQLLAAGRFNEAQETLREVSLLDPGVRAEADRLMRQVAEAGIVHGELNGVEQLIRQGRVDEAHQICHRVLVQHPDNPRALALLGREAEARAKRAHAGIGPTVHARVARRRISSAMRRWLVRGIVLCVLALLVILGVFVIYPKTVESARTARFVAAAKWLRNGNAELAAREYKSIEDDYPNTDVAQTARDRRVALGKYVAEAGALKIKGDAAFKKGEFEQALVSYREAAEKYPLSRRGVLARQAVGICTQRLCDQLLAEALSQGKAKRWDVAKTIYEKILKLDEAQPRAKEGLQAATQEVAKYSGFMKQGQAMARAGRLVEARVAFEHALAVLPEDKEAYESRKRALMRIPPPEGMVLIVPGEFVIGSEDGNLDERPRRMVKLRGFYMDKTEVTNAQYAEFVADTGNRPPSHWQASRPPAAIANRPVVCVSWHEATAYAAWAGKRLPTEIEWERAARGPHGRRYPWGDTFAPMNGVFADDARPVGTRASDCSEEGCFDLGGNVSEWTASEITETYSSDNVARTPKRRPGYKIVKGASWAGLERERRTRIVPGAIATLDDDHTWTVVVDSPDAWGIAVEAFGEVEFYLVARHKDSATIGIRKYVRGPDKFFSAFDSFKKGERIALTKRMRIGAGRAAGSVRVHFDTGCVLVGVSDGDDSQITYKDAGGDIKQMQRGAKSVRRTYRDEKSALSSDADARQRYRAVVRQLYERSIRDIARCANRMAAPASARFINCGFRCAKDP